MAATKNSQIHRFSLGNFECFSILDGSFNYPVDSFFANAPEKQVAESLRRENLPTNHINTPYACLLIDTGQYRIMIDTGAGNLDNVAAKLFPTVDHSTTVTGQLLQNMKAAGIQPRTIDFVIITHAHPDHIGGNLDNEGELVFKNARYYIARDEWRFWTSNAANTKAPLPMVNIARRNLEPLQERLTIIDDASEIVAGISAIAAPGHTPGHIAVSFTSADQQLLHVSDAALHPLHLQHPEWRPVFDIDPEQADQSKRSLFDRAAREQALVFAHHFPPFPNLGYVIARESGWQWQPIKTSS